jgi:hypothetical protein
MSASQKLTLILDCNHIQANGVAFQKRHGININSLKSIACPNIISKLRSSLHRIHNIKQLVKVADGKITPYSQNSLKHINK